MADVEYSGRGPLSKLWSFAVGTTAALAVSTIIAGATGGLSLTADAAIAAGNSVASTAAVPVSPIDLLSLTGQGLAHNLGGIADGAVWAAEGIQGMLPE